MITTKDRWYRVGTCCVDENGKMIKTIYEGHYYTLDSANAQFDDIIKNIENTNRQLHRKHADLTVYLNEYIVTNRAKGEGTVTTIRRETV